ncbi:MAG: toll/interleukin-1 receptor domain-containing protein [Candidatus Sumerlaeota bacterium]|nr:toll/interleukin-1 receptor domain-containing protein [Candidatus Sumerlaeota bacterium]
MPEGSFPKPVSEVVATLTDIFRHQQRAEAVELLESAHACFDQTEYDNWNGGTYIWALRLEIPVPLFASIEPRLSKIEEDITAKLKYFDRLYPNDHLHEVTVSPIAPGMLAAGQRMAPSEIEVRRLWPEGRFRLFLSHVSEHKIAVSRLKGELEHRGVAAFVAHEDIAPSLEWQREIELALRSMQALVALITPDFHGSLWTDQELGWALGRGILLIPVRLGVDPYGLANKYQGVNGILEQPAQLAKSLVSALLYNEQTHGAMRRSLVSAFVHATSPEMAQTLCSHIVKVADFTEEERATLVQACNENGQVSEAFGVRESIFEAIGRPPEPKATEDDLPF